MKKNVFASVLVLAICAASALSSPICSSCLHGELLTADYLSAIATLQAAQGDREERLLEIAIAQQLNARAIELRRVILPIDWRWKLDMNELARQGNALTKQYDDLYALIRATYDNIDAIQAALDALVAEISSCPCKG